MLIGTSNDSSTAVNYVDFSSAPTTNTTVDDIIYVSQPLVAIGTYSHTIQSLVKDVKIEKLMCENCGGAIDKDTMCCKFCGSAYMIKEIYR